MEFIYSVKLSKAENDRILLIPKTLEDLENTVDVLDCLYESIEEILGKEYCTCIPNESYNYCDCERDWDGEFKIVSRNEYIGKTDINNKKIYADCSVVEFDYCGIKRKGYFRYNDSRLRYYLVDANGNDFHAWSGAEENLRVIDTIQENKLGLINAN